MDGWMDGQARCIDAWMYVDQYFYVALLSPSFDACADH
jgi:hypothetical protein